MIAITEFAFLSESIVAVRTYELDVVSAAGLVCVATNPDLSSHFGDSLEFDGPIEEVNIINNLINGIEERVMEAMFGDSCFGPEQTRAEMLLAFGINGEDFEAGIELRLKDLVAAIQLFREGVCTFREAVEIAKQ